MIAFGEEWQIPIFSEEEGRRRHDRIRELMDYDGIDCLVIAGHTGNHRGQFGNIRYVSNYINWFGVLRRWCEPPGRGLLNTRSSPSVKAP
jgi:hypothetical protein